MMRGYVAIATMTFTTSRPAITKSRFDAIVTGLGRVRGPGGAPGGVAGYGYVMRVPPRVEHSFSVPGPCHGFAAATAASRRPHGRTRSTDATTSPPRRRSVPT